MKKGIHPTYEFANVSCACGMSYQTRTTVGDLKVDICSSCHPFFTGTQKIVDAEGRVERFNKRYAKKTATTKAKAKASRVFPLSVVLSHYFLLWHTPKPGVEIHQPNGVNIFLFFSELCPMVLLAVGSNAENANDNKLVQQWVRPWLI